MDFSSLHPKDELPLGEVFQYILSMEWGKSPDPQASKCIQDADRNENKENDQNQPR